MKRISAEKEIEYISRVIEKNIKYYDVLNDKGFLSENILSQLRNLVEDVAILINNKHNNLNLDTNYNNIRPSFDYIEQIAKYNFIVEFYDFLKGTASHYTPSEDGAEKLVSFYFRYICLIKIFLRDEYGIDIIKNIEDFPMYDDKSMKENYNIICKAIDETSDSKLNYIKGKFYIQKENVIYSNGKIYYELTLTKATDYVNKFERITMYSSIYIPDNYSVNISCIDKEVRLNVGKTKIKIINSYKVAIRVCELKNLFKCLGVVKNFDDEYKEYRNLMKYLTDNKNTITEILLSTDEIYNNIVQILSKDAENHIITNTLSKIRNHIINQEPGHNVLRYVTTKMENLVIRDQLSQESNFVFPSLYLNIGSGPFDSMPYAMSLYKHNVSWFHLIKSVDMANREHELLYRTIHNNVENEKILYTPMEKLVEFENVIELANKFNKEYLTIKKDGDNILIVENGYIFIKSYESKSLHIISQLERYLNKSDEELSGALKYYNESLLDKSVISVDKVSVFNTILTENRLAFIYGSAGTGKTKFIELLSAAFENYNKYYVAVTHTAVSNLSARVHNNNCTFKTVSDFKKNNCDDCEILFLDECSMISNDEIISILSKREYRAIILVGDICQIESIKYSNWFQLCSRYFNEKVKFELTYTHRTKDEDLLALWDAVRNDDKKAINILSNQEYTQPLSEEIFNKTVDDEIVLCLNYDGMYGINNINKVRQGTNANDEYNFGIDTYKKEDRILFNDCPRFRNFLYNNLKGVIKNIEIDDEQKYCWFTIEIDKDSIDLNFVPPDIQVYESEKEDKVNIRFKVNEYKDKNDDENEYGHIIPFNLAYAISIHKAQGLEYDSVKIVITSNIEEHITKNIFYTAITRSKKLLKVYWNSDSQTKIFENFKNDSSNKDIAIIRQKINLLKKMESI